MDKKIFEKKNNTTSKCIYYLDFILNINRNNNKPILNTTLNYVLKELRVKGAAKFKRVLDKKLILQISIIQILLRSLTIRSRTVSIYATSGRY